MEYSTRHLIAQKPFRHEGVDLKPGDPFEASKADARYYTTRGHAKPAVVAAVPVVAASAPAAPPKPSGRRGRPPAQPPVVKADEVPPVGESVVNTEEVPPVGSADDAKLPVDNGI